jgi:hypothetical protein
MAKPITVSLAGEVSRFDFQKLERARLYGSRRRVALDAEGQACRKAALTRDGRFLIRSGMTGQGYLTDEGRWVPNGDLVGLDASGAVVAKQPSTLGVEQPLEEVPPTALLDLRPTGTWVLTPQHLAPALAEALAAGRIFRFAFNYRGDFRAETGFLVQNDAGCFAVVGEPLVPEWVAPAAAPPAVAPADEADADDLDFEMF